MSIALSSFAGVGSQFFDDNGNVLSGGLVYTYAAGTLNPLATYNDAAGLIPHSNPIVLDSGGRIPSGGVMWVTAELDYDFVVRSSIGQLIATYQDINNFQGDGNAFATALVDDLRTDLAAPTGSDLVGYGIRTLTGRLDDFVSANNYSTLQAAMDSGNRLLWLSAKTYTETAQLTINVPFLCMFGHGATINFTPATGVGLLSNQETDNTVVLRGIKFNGNSGSRTVNRATMLADIDLSGAANIDIQDCEFIDMTGNSVIRTYVGNTADSSIIRIKDNNFSGGEEATATTNDTTSFIQLRYVAAPINSMSWDVSDNVFNGVVPTLSKAGIGGVVITGENDDADSSTGPKVTIRDNVFYNIGFDTAAGNKIGGVVAYRVAPYSVISGNRVLGSYETGIDVQGSKGVTVTDNILVDITATAIAYSSRDSSPLKNCSQGVIANNQIIDGLATAIVLAGDPTATAFEDFIVTGNMIKDCYRGMFTNKLEGSLIISNNIFSGISVALSGIDSQMISIFGDKDTLSTQKDLDVILSNNTFIDCTANIYINGVASVNFNGNTMDNITSTASVKQAVAAFKLNDMTVTNNQFKTCVGFISTNPSGTLMISDNKFTSASGIRCIGITGGQNTMIADNVFVDVLNDVINYATLGVGSRNVLHGNIFPAGATVRNVSGQTISYLAATFADGNLTA